MGLLDSLFQEGSMLSELSTLVTQNPEILEAATSLLTPREGTVGPSGGLRDVLEAFQQKGLGDIVSSWLANGPNQAVAPTQVRDALGPDILAQFARKAGVQDDQAPSVLAGILPELVNQLSPQGAEPDAGSLEGLLGTLLRGRA